MKIKHKEIKSSTLWEGSGVIVRLTWSNSGHLRDTKHSTTVVPCQLMWKKKNPGKKKWWTHPKTVLDGAFVTTLRTELLQKQLDGEGATNFNYQQLENGWEYDGGKELGTI